MLRIGIAQAEDLDTLSAVQSVISKCRRQLRELNPQAGIVFAGIEFNHKEMLAEILRSFPGLELVGCTTAGELSSEYGFSDDSINLMVLHSDTIEIKAGVGREASADPAAATDEALDQARKGLTQEESLCLAFPDWLNGSAEELVDALNRKLAPQCPVFGGISGQQGEIGQPALQFFNDEVLQGSVPLLLFAGAMQYAFSVSNSWEPVGMRTKVTEVNGAEIKRIGDMPALDFYRYYLGEHTSPAHELPLAVYEDDDTDFYIRTPASYDVENGSITFFGQVPDAAKVQLTEATRARLIENTKASVQAVADDWPGPGRPGAALIFSCAARKMILGSHTREELRILKDILPDRLPIMGFYAYGELSPLRSSHETRLHNCSMVTLLFGETGADSVSAEDVTYEPPRRLTQPSYGSQIEGLKKENLFLRKKLARSNRQLERLEYLKDLNDSLLRKINREINAARLEIERKNELILQTLTLADEVQHNLLPQENPDIDRLDIAGKSVYCTKTGGDYYDFLRDPASSEGRFSVVVGDVTGHGIEAALLMTTVRALLRSRVSQPGTISQIINDINRQLALDVRDSGRFMTLFYLTIDPIERSLHWVRAGHDPAIFYDPEGDYFEEMRGDGIALGVDANWQYTENKRMGISKGQIIVLGTDGIWEAHNRKREMFGKARVYDIIRQNADLSAKEIVDEVIAALTHFLKDQAQEDDITLVVAKINGDPE